VSRVEAKHAFPDRLAIATIVGIALFVGLAHFHDAFDDAFITYRYARNLAIGNGFVYNVGERYLGTSAPLYGIVLGLLAIPNPDSIPTLGGLLSLLGLIFASLGIWEIGKDADRRLAGLLSACLFALHPIAHMTFSGEMLPQAALVLWGIVFYVRRKLGWTTALLAMATLVRPDAALAAIVIGGWEIWTQKKVPVNPAILYAAIVLPFFAACWIYYGYPMPQTLQAKVAQSSQGWPLLIEPMVDSSKGFAGMYLPSQILSSKAVLLFNLSCLIGVYSLSGYKAFFLPLAWSVAFCSVMQAVGLPFYHWYYLPACLAFCILAGVGGAALLSVKSIPSRLAGAACLLALPCTEVRQTAQQLRHPPYPEYYARLGSWLACNTPADASVGHCEIGIMGYYSHRKILDPLGLVNPGFRSLVAQGRMAQVFRLHRPDYIVDMPRFGGMYMDRVKSSQWFKAEYQVASVLPNGDQPITVYKRMRYIQRG
jgi:hypothetical protein